MLKKSKFSLKVIVFSLSLIAISINLKWSDSYFIQQANFVIVWINSKFDYN